MRQRAFRPGFDRTGGNFGRFGKAGEMKFHDVAINSVAVANTWTIFNSGSINLIAQGTTESERIGRKVTIKKILIRVLMTQPTHTNLAASDDLVRWVVYVDKQANGATAASDGIAGIMVADSPNTFRTLANTGRFAILLDQVVNMNVMAAAGNGTANDTAEIIKQRKFFKSVNIPLEFNSTAGAITEIRSNNIGVMAISIGGTITFAASVRLRFTDN